MRLSILFLVIALAGCGARTTTYGLNDFDTGARRTFKSPQEWRAGQQHMIDRVLDEITPLESPFAKKAIVVLPLREQFKERSQSAGFAAFSSEAFETSIAMDEDLWFVFPKAITRKNIFEEVEVRRSMRPTQSMLPAAGFLIWIDIDEKMYIANSEKEGFLEFPKYVETLRSYRMKAWLKDVEEYVLKNPVSRP